MGEGGGGVGGEDEQSAIIAWSVCVCAVERSFMEKRICKMGSDFREMHVPLCLIVPALVHIIMCIATASIVSHSRTLTQSLAQAGFVCRLSWPYFQVDRLFSFFVFRALALSAFDSVSWEIHTYAFELCCCCLLFTIKCI